MTRDRQSGLTLIEVLVSLSIFAIVGMAGLALLQSLARTEARLSDQSLSLEAADSAFTLLERAMANAEGFQLRDEALTLQIGGMTQTFVVAEGAFLRRIRQQDQAIDQSLLAVRSARWSQIPAPHGTLIRLEITFTSALSGERLFFVAGSPS